MIFVELNMKGRQHLLANCGFVDQFAESEKTNLFFADQVHAREISGMSAVASTVRNIAMPVVRSGSGAKAVVKTLIEAFSIFLVFLVSLVRRDDIFFLSSYASVKIVIEMLSRVFPARVYLVHHGELTGLEQTSTARHSKFVRRYFAARRSRKLTDVFLSASIMASTFTAIGCETPSSVVVLHPFPKNAAGGKKKEPGRGNKLQIGYFGALSLANRGRLQAMISALARRAEAAKSQDFELTIIAPGSESFDYSGLVSVRTVDTTVQITNQEFASMLAGFDVAIFPYEAHQYDLTASGIAVDCLLHQIKFIAATSGFFYDWIMHYPGAGALFPSFGSLLHALEDPKIELLNCGK